MRGRFDLISSVSVILVFAILETVSILLMVNNSVVQRFRLLGAVREVQSYFWDKGERIGYYFSFREQNDQLVTENIALKQKLALYEAYAAALDTIDPIVNMDFTYTRAKVVKNSVNSQHNYIIIDKGAEDGVKEGMGIVTDNGVIGLVNAVSRNFARVSSFLDVDQSVSARISNDGIFGPLVWKGTEQHAAVIHDIPIHEIITVGDTVLSSGFSAIYPPDIPLGIVTGSEPSGGVSRNVDVRLFEDFGSLKYVYVVESNIIDEINELESDE